MNRMMRRSTPLSVCFSLAICRKFCGIVARTVFSSVFRYLLTGRHLYHDFVFLLRCFMSNVPLQRERAVCLLLRCFPVCRTAQSPFRRVPWHFVSSPEPSCRAERFP